MMRAYCVKIGIVVVVIENIDFNFTAFVNVYRGAQVNDRVDNVVSVAVII